MMQERSDFYVYLHRRATDGRVFYVGKGTGPRAWVWQNRNPYWSNTKKKHGLEVEIALCDLTEGQAFFHEMRLIEELRSLGEPITNLTDGGEGMSGYVYTEEHRAKISESQKCRVRSEEEIEKWRNSRSGYTHSQETRKKISSSLSGSLRGTVAQEVRDKISASNTGKTHSAETRAKISAAKSGIPRCKDATARAAISNTGKKRSEETKRKIGKANSIALRGKKIAPHVRAMLIDIHTKRDPIVCLTNGRVFETATEARDWCIAAGYLSAKSGRIRRVCNGHGEKCYGHKWAFFQGNGEGASS
jgi:hypothetical protein